MITSEITNDLTLTWTHFLFLLCPFFKKIINSCFPFAEKLPFLPWRASIHFKTQNDVISVTKWRHYTSEILQLNTMLINGEKASNKMKICWIRWNGNFKSLVIIENIYTIIYDNLKIIKGVPKICSFHRWK